MPQPALNAHTLQLPPKPPVGSRPENTINLDKGEQPYPPSPKVIEAIQLAAASAHQYPDPNGWELRQAIAEYSNCAPENIVLGNGSDELIELVVKTHASVGDNIIVPIPSFFVYGFAAQMLGVETRFVPRQADFSVDVDAVVEAANERTRVVYVANPNNPTGTLTPRDSLQTLLERCNCSVVVDECYFEFSKTTIADLINQHENLIVLRSFSKGFGLAGLRIGYAIANANAASAMFRSAHLFSTNCVAQAAATAALTDLDYTNACIAEILEGRAFLAAELASRGFEVWPSDTNFLYVSCKQFGVESGVIVDRLKQVGIYVADFGNKPGTDAFAIRIAVGNQTQNQKLVEAVDQIKASLTD